MVICSGMITIRINRYIMECKYLDRRESECQKERINRYIMECKCRTDVGINSRSMELIDTLWNVNFLS